MCWGVVHRKVLTVHEHNWRLSPVLDCDTSGPIIPKQPRPAPSGGRLASVVNPEGSPVAAGRSSVTWEQLSAHAPADAQRQSACHTEEGHGVLGGRRAVASKSVRWPPCEDGLSVLEGALTPSPHGSAGQWPSVSGEGHVGSRSVTIVQVGMGGRLAPCYHLPAAITPPPKKICM